MSEPIPVHGPENAGPTGRKPTWRDDGLLGMPEHFGPFTLLRRVGRGGWTSVYEARRTGEVPGIHVAVKRLERLGSAAVRRMFEEAVIARQLESARIPRLLDTGSVDGVPYLVFELIDGMDLATLLYRVRARRHMLPTEVLLELLLQTGLALRVAHTWIDPEKRRPEPIVHCDLKPSNILIGRDGLVRLSDFGAARQGGWLSESPDGLVGTVGYVAPERVVLEQAPPLGPAADLFSLGVVGYELCTLRPLFTGSPAQILQQLLQADRYIPVALSRLPEGLHPRIAAVLERLLAARPEQRFSHIDDALRPLQELRQQLQLQVDLGSAIVPYLEPTLGEREAQRITDVIDVTVIRNAVSRVGMVHRDSDLPASTGGSLFPAFVGVTHLTREQIRALIPPVKRQPLTVAGVQEAQHRRRNTLILQLLGMAVLLLLGGLGMNASLPKQIALRSTPEGALASLQPGCEGTWSIAQLTPSSLRTRGPWPVCVAVEAPGHIRSVARVLEPGMFYRTTHLELSLDREACVRVGSRPTGLPVYLDNRLRGSTGYDDLKVCGLQPFEPYVVQIDYEGARWDVIEVNARPGEVVDVFQDFSANLRVTASPFERCNRYFASEEYARAIELCRVAVVEAPTLEQKIEALILQGLSYAAQDEIEAACDLFGYALDRAVDARRLALERRVVDVREEHDCEAVERARALREAEEAEEGEDGEGVEADSSGDRKAATTAKSTRKKDASLGEPPAGRAWKAEDFPGGKAQPEGTTGSAAPVGGSAEAAPAPAKAESAAPGAAPAGAPAEPAAAPAEPAKASESPAGGQGQ